MMGQFLLPRRNCPSPNIKKNDEFESIMEGARALAEEDPQLLHVMIAMLMRPMQSEAMIKALSNKWRGEENLRKFHEEHYVARRMEDLLIIGDYEKKFDEEFDKQGRSYFYKCFERNEIDSISINLSGCSLISETCTKESLIKKENSNKGVYKNGKQIGGLIAALGAARKNPWKQSEDIGQHVVELYLPWKIGFVIEGKHSIATGIFLGEGSLKIPAKNISNGALALEKFETDGTFFYLIGSDKERKIGRARSQRFAAIFEIGRIMKNKGISR